MNPDVFITIVFVGIAALAALVALVVVVPQIRRYDARVAPRGSERPPLEKTAESSVRLAASDTGKGGRDAAVH